MDLDRRSSLVGPNHPSSSNQLQGNLAVQLSRPTDGELQPFPRQKVRVRAEQDAIAAHVDGLAEADFIDILTVENLVANFPFDGEAIRGTAVVLVFFEFHSCPR